MRHQTYLEFGNKTGVKFWSGLLSGRENSRGNRKTEVASVGGQFQFQSDPMHLLKVAEVTADDTFQELW